MVLAVVPAAAQDQWWDKNVATPYKPAARKPLREPKIAAREPDSVFASDTVRRAPKKRLSVWRTIVIPAPLTPSEAIARTAGPGMAGWGPARGRAPPPALTGYAHELSGLASYYADGQLTSSGEAFDKMAFTAAHKTLPLGTRVRVTNLTNGRSTLVRINDRGPFKPGRVIDLSEAAAAEIAMTGPGIARVKLEVVK